MRVGGETWTDTAAGIALPPHRRRLGFVFQEYALFPHLSAIDNVAIAISRGTRVERRARAAELLSGLQLSERVSRRPHELSGGERQRVALARALARDPDLLLLDEPFAAVDRSVRRRLQDQINALRVSRGMPMMLVTHDFDDVVRLATHVLLIERGRTVASGPIGDVMSRPDLGWLREAVGLGSVFQAVVAGVDSSRGLAELRFGGGTLRVSSRGLVSGASVRIRIPAREVILASTEPLGLSVHNILPAHVLAVHDDPAFDHPILQLGINGATLLAEVTHDAVARLQLGAGRAVYALIKSVSVEVLPVE